MERRPSTYLTHWGRVTHICVSKLTIIGSDNGLSPGRRQAIIRTNAGILLIRPFGTNFSEILIEIIIFSFKKMRLKVSSGEMAAILSRPRCVNRGPELGLKRGRLELQVLTRSIQNHFFNVSFVWKCASTAEIIRASKCGEFSGEWTTRNHTCHWRWQIYISLQFL